MATKTKDLNFKKRRKVVEKVRRFIGKNYSDESIMVECNIRPDLLRNIKAEILNMDTAIFEHFSSGGVYSDYLMKSQQMIRKLQELQRKFKGRGQWTALVAAVKQESEIYDKCVKLGQDFGYIEKKAQSLEVSGEFTFGHLTEAELKKEIENEVKSLNQLAKGKVIDMRPELTGITDEDVTSFIPAKLISVPEDSSTKRKVKVKSKLRLRKQV